METIEKQLCCARHLKGCHANYVFLAAHFYKKYITFVHDVKLWGQVMSNCIFIDDKSSAS